jgi:hypothetical protein
MSNVTLKGGDLLTQNPTQLDYCKESGVKFNISQLFVDVKFKQTESHFDYIKHASVKVSDWEGKLQNQNGKATRQSNTAHIL